MTTMTESKLSIFTPRENNRLLDHFHIEAHIGPGQYGPRLRLRPIWVSLFQMLEVCNKQFNIWAFPYWPGYHPSTHICFLLGAKVIYHTVVKKTFWLCIVNHLGFNSSWFPMAVSSVSHIGMPLLLFKRQNSAALL